MAGWPESPALGGAPGPVRLGMGVRGRQRVGKGRMTVGCGEARYHGHFMGGWTGVSALPRSGIEWAADAEAGFVQDMKVDLGGGEVAVSKEFLDGSEVVVVFQEMGGEAVAEGEEGEF